MSRFRGFSRRWLFGGLFLIVSSSAFQAPAEGEPETRNISVRVDPRVELVSIVFRLAGNSEYGQGRVKSYVEDIDRHFKPFQSNELIEYAAGLRTKYGVSYDACMSMAVHLNADNGWKLRFPLEPRPEGLDGRWRDRSAQEFAARLNTFAKDSDFDKFFEEHRKLYETTQERMETLLTEQVHSEWFDEFFGERPSARFTVVPGLVNGGANYGPHVKTPDGKEEFYCILGVWRTDWSGQPRFDLSMVGTIIHEFCHSYTNAIVDRHEDAFQQAGQTIFPHVTGVMRRQGYGQWKTMIYESLVRASVIRYKHRYENRDVAREIGRQKQRGFEWIEGLSDLLGEYEENRDKYPTLDAFAPQIVEYFDHYAKEFEAERRKAVPPRIVSMSPANGDDRVDPDVTEIRIEFDRAMRDGTWTFFGFGEHFPEVAGKPSYDAGCTTWSVQVHLQPDREYRFWLNTNWFNGFRSAGDAALEPVEIRFRTAPRRPGQTPGDGPNSDSRREP